MKKKLFAFIAAFILLSCGAFGAVPAVSARAVTIDDASSSGKISYSTVEGVNIKIISNTFDPRQPQTDVFQKVEFPLSGKGSAITLSCILSNAKPIKIKLALSGETATDCGEYSVSVGENAISLNAADYGFTGAADKLILAVNAMMYTGCSLTVTSADYADGSRAWKNGDGFKKTIHESITSEVSSVTNGELVMKGAEKGGWYPVLCHTDKKDMSAYVGFSFYADTTKNNRSVYFNKYVQEIYSSGGTDVVGEQWYTPDTAAAAYYPQGGKPFNGAVNEIPSYFKGRIYVRFSVFQKPDWTNKGNDVFDTDKTDGVIGLTFNGDRGDCAFIIRDFTLETVIDDVSNSQSVFGDVTCLDDMENYTDSQSVAYGWRTNWSLASPCSIELVDNSSGTVGAGGKALRITPEKAPENPEPDTATGMTEPTNYTALEYFPAGGTLDISGAKGITFYIENTKNLPFVINFEFDILQNGVRQRWTVKKQARYILYDTARGTQRYMNAVSGAYIPANFKGWVRVSFAQFANPAWETVGGDFTDKNGLAYFVLSVNTLEFEGHTFVFDSVGIYRDETDIRTMFAAPEYTVDKAIESRS